jgi:hypothetical protein
MDSANGSNPGEQDTFLKTLKNISSPSGKSDASSQAVPLESIKSADRKTCSMPIRTLLDSGQPDNCMPERQCPAQGDEAQTEIPAILAAKLAALLSTAQATAIDITERELRLMPVAADWQSFTGQGLSAGADSAVLMELIARLEQSERMPASAVSAWLHRFRQVMAMATPLQGNALNKELCAEDLCFNPIPESEPAGSFQNGIHRGEFDPKADLNRRMADGAYGLQKSFAGWRSPSIGDANTINLTKSESAQAERNMRPVLNSENWEKFSYTESAPERQLENTESPLGPAAAAAKGPSDSLEKAHFGASANHLNRMAASAETEQRGSGADLQDLSQKRETAKGILNTDSPAANKSMPQPLPNEEAVSKIINDAQLIRDTGPKPNTLSGEELGGKILKTDAGNSDLSPPGSQSQTIDRTLETASSAKETEIGRGRLQDQTVDQIVKKAFIHLRNGQAEAKIHLKPEFLGHIRMQVMTENQQVSIKILTEYPFVKEMLENNIQQLKSELQQQGLVVDRLEVSVSRDSAEFGHTRENTPWLRPKHRRAGKGTKLTSADEISGKTRATELSPEASTIVDYFA